MSLTFGRGLRQLASHPVKSPWANPLKGPTRRPLVRWVGWWCLHPDW